MPTRIDPAASVLAQANGLDPETIQGTGPDGAVTEEDVIRALEAQMGMKAQSEQPSSPNNPGCLFGLFK